MRLLDMERRQKQRVEEMRETQKKVFSFLIFCTLQLICHVKLTFPSILWPYILHMSAAHLLYPFTLAGGFYILSRLIFNYAFMYT